ncbi:hypothetical protein [Allotamlana fucoidanivorans]|uniref:AAA family ATPase n=2 Tax=Allotamlana fucoidanivorans TaxID=2583814 RepID=A0A5C4SLI6_9FLAO|nr:hypothetical protein [Tamlana fucoidanivorans]TNJ44519.1 hypothetical protein FGF67_07690 [Tamlana fucoidanivorans]
MPDIEKIKISPTVSEELTPQELIEIHDKCIVRLDQTLLPEPIALSIGTHSYKDRIYPTPFGTYGNFSCLVGASKSMKTFLKSALIASYIGGKSNYYFPDMRGHDTKEKYVIDVDTEQSLWHTQRVAKRACEMVGNNYEYFKAFSTREEDPKIRFQFIEWIMMESSYRDNIGLITIDGAADILESVNDLEYSNKIVQGMLKWTSISKSHLCTILHKNPGTEKPTGHLGSAIMKKAETVAFIDRDSEHNIVRVLPSYTRGYPFDEFSFTLNDDYLPKVVNSI